jgi:protocatechuate 3,4-dioxygenase beta subunit
MYSALRVLLLSAFVQLAFSQTTQVPPVSTGSVEGTVVRADTREPLKKAWVALRSEVEGAGPTYGALTDAAGRFVLKDIVPGRYRLWADRNGFVGQAYGQRGPESAGTVLSISPGQTIRDVQVALYPSAVISGHVYDDDAEPVVNAHVNALKFSYQEGKRKLRPVGFGQTNDLGEFRIFGLAPGSYFVSATFGGWDRPQLASGPSSASGGGAGEEMAYAPTYYPGTNDLGRAIAVELKPGEEVSGIDINLLSTRAVRIRGRILTPVTGKGETQAWIMLMPREAKVQSFSPSAHTMVNNAQGEFELQGVVPGSYTLIAHTFGVGEVYEARIPLEVGPTDIDGLIVPLGRPAEIPGRVRWEGVNQSNSGHIVRVMLNSREEQFMSMTSGQQTKLDGTFVLNNVADGEYQIRIEGAPDDCYLRSALLGGEDVLASGVSIAAGRVRGPLEIAMNCAGGILEGTVTNEQLSPVPGASVVLVPDTERRGMTHLFKTTTSDQYGRFSLRGVAPGEYKAFAWQKIERGAYQDSEFLRRYEDAGKPVTMREGGRFSVQLELILTEKSLP